MSLDNTEEIQTILNRFSYNDMWKIKGLVEVNLMEKSEERITNNFTGERAVDLAIETYNKTTSLPNLTRAVNGTKDFDVYAASSGERYSIKSLKGNNKTTSAICAFNEQDSKHNFEFVLIVRLSNLYQLVEIIEIPLGIAQQYAKQNTRDKNFKLSYTNKLRNDSNIKITYCNSDSSLNN